MHAVGNEINQQIDCKSLMIHRFCSRQCGGAVCGINSFDNPYNCRAIVTEQYLDGKSSAKPWKELLSIQLLRLLLA